MDDDYEKWDGIVQSILKNDEGESLYIKAENVDVRSYVVSLLLPHLEGQSIPAFIEGCKQLEEYIKYGRCTDDR